ncbi:hypothetical protein GBA63_16785 [Rubrobacter tropicus]|uniref:Uncharacterized protein n=1 Tax=Rubrobacter tropicus TaxID=2653851 RepID=A0A6G8QCA6_9ACTN|nr:hypothetical protein [Rubrobacter tropicus]QIN84116.1 hypothetical protein GBA63_16785 [Rubrobacter tropicus]
MAITVGLANALPYNASGSSPWGGPFVWWFDLNLLFVAHTFSAVLAGLLVSGSLLLFAHCGLRGDFFARYGLMVLAVCVGGALLGVFLYNSIILLDDQQPMPAGLMEVLFTIAFPAVAGGILGAVEGVFLAFPLAWSLGRFGNETTAQVESRA